MSSDEVFDRSRLAPIPIASRVNKVSTSMFGELARPDATVSELVASLPDILAGPSLRGAIEAVATAVRNERPVFAAMGGHVVKVGLGPLFIDLIERGVVDALVFNGSTAIHDFEIALIGETSEDVLTNVADGSFGMADETGAGFARASANAQAKGIGLGRALGELLEEMDAPHREKSMLAACAARDIPVCVHVAVGTDIVHMHPAADGAALGDATFQDFLLLAKLVEDLDHGVWMNIGSAVVLPEVFLKVVNMARNVGKKLEGVTALNFDMLQHYRTQANVIERPVARGISLTGHHEIMLPLFRAALLAELDGNEESR